MPNPINKLSLINLELESMYIRSIDSHHVKWYLTNMEKTNTCLQVNNVCLTL